MTHSNNFSMLGLLMRFFSSLLLIFCCSLTLATPIGSDEQQCLAYVRLSENYKSAHQSGYCIRTKNAESGSALYSVGMAYGFAGNPASEEDYYRLAANKRNIASYLALGHMLSEARPWESIYWYQRYIYTKADGYGYAALKVSRIFEGLGESGQAAYWLEACRSSVYQGCN